MNLLSYLALISMYGGSNLSVVMHQIFI